MEDNNKSWRRKLQFQLLEHYVDIGNMQRWKEKTKSREQKNSSNVYIRITFFMDIIKTMEQTLKKINHIDKQRKEKEDITWIYVHSYSKR